MKFEEQRDRLMAREALQPTAAVLNSASRLVPAHPVIGGFTLSGEMASAASHEALVVRAACRMRSAVSKPECVGPDQECSGLQPASKPSMRELPV